MKAGFVCRWCEDGAMLEFRVSRLVGKAMEAAGFDYLCVDVESGKIQPPSGDGHSPLNAALLKFEVELLKFRGWVDLEPQRSVTACDSMRRWFYFVLACEKSRNKEMREVGKQAALAIAYSVPEYARLFQRMEGDLWPGDSKPLEIDLNAPEAVSGRHSGIAEFAGRIDNFFRRFEID